MPKLESSDKSYGKISRHSFPSPAIKFFTQKSKTYFYSAPRDGTTYPSSKSKLATLIDEINSDFSHEKIQAKILPLKLRLTKNRRDSTDVAVKLKQSSHPAKEAC